MPVRSGGEKCAFSPSRVTFYCAVIHEGPSIFKFIIMLYVVVVVVGNIKLAESMMKRMGRKCAVEYVCRRRKGKEKMLCYVCAYGVCA